MECEVSRIRGMHCWGSATVTMGERNGPSRVSVALLLMVGTCSPLVLQALMECRILCDDADDGDECVTMSC
jgi:hypothetical protein